MSLGALGHPRPLFSELELLYVCLKGFKIQKQIRQVALILLFSYWFKSETGMCFLEIFFHFPLRKLPSWPCSFALHSCGFTTRHHLHFQTSTWQGGHRCPAGRVCKHKNSRILLLPLLTPSQKCSGLSVGQSLLCPNLLPKPPTLAVTAA